MKDFRGSVNRPVVIFKRDELWMAIHDRLWGQRDISLKTGLSQETVSRACTGQGVSVRSAGKILRVLRAERKLQGNPLIASVTATSFRAEAPTWAPIATAGGAGD